MLTSTRARIASSVDANTFPGDTAVLDAYQILYVPNVRALLLAPAQIDGRDQVLVDGGASSGAVMIRLLVARLGPRSAAQDRRPPARGSPSGASAWLPSWAGSGVASGTVNQNVEPAPLVLWTPTCP